MNIQEHISLKNYNTFGVDVLAKRFISINYLHELQEVVQQEQKLFLLSGGSNMLLTKAINDALVVHINCKGIAIDRETEAAVFLTVNAGEHWHDFVSWTVREGYGGLENLSLIPGNVGTCPIQNIGAYGVEVKDTITKVTALEIATGKMVEFSNTDCAFGYRNSVFKQALKGQYIITSVSFKLSKHSHQLHTSYGAIETWLTEHQKPTSIHTIAEAVIAIRQSKLPDPAVLGNSGSFFKNPVVSHSHFTSLQKEYPTMPHYLLEDQQVKIPAGWLIEQAGFKGKRFGDAGVHEKQALVLVNYGKASGKEILDLAHKIQDSIKTLFSISLEIEVNII